VKPNISKMAQNIDEIEVNQFTHISQICLLNKH